MQEGGAVVISETVNSEKENSFAIIMLRHEFIILNVYDGWLMG